MDCIVSLMKSERCQDRPVPFESPLNELARSKPFEVMSLYSSGEELRSTHVALGFRMGRVSFDLGLTAVSSCFLIWVETVRDHSSCPIKKPRHRTGAKCWEETIT